MSRSALMLGLLIGSVVGFLSRPLLVPSDAATSHSVPDHSAAKHPGRSRVSLDTGSAEAPAAHASRGAPGEGPTLLDGTTAFEWPDADETAEDAADDLEWRRREWRFRRDPSSSPPPPPSDEEPPTIPTTAEGLRQALLSDDRDSRVSTWELVNRLGEANGTDTIASAFTARLVRAKRIEAALACVHRWTGDDLVDGLRRAVAESDGDAVVFRPLARTMASVLRRRRATTAPKALIRECLSHRDARLRKAGAALCMLHHAPHGDLLVEVLESEQDPDLAAHALVCLDELLEHDLLPAEAAADVILTAARSADLTVRETALLSFPRIASASAGDALRLLQDSTFRVIATREQITPLLMTLVATGRLSDLPEAAWNARLATMAVSAVESALNGEAAYENEAESESNRYASASALFPDLLRHIPPDSDLEWLFKVAHEHADDAFILRSIRNRELRWEHRSSAIDFLFWEDDLRASARALTISLIQDATESAALRAHLVASVEPPDADPAREQWLRMLEATSAGEPRGWLRSVMRQAVRDYRE